MVPNALAASPASFRSQKAGACRRLGAMMNSGDVTLRGATVLPEDISGLATATKN